MTTTSHFGGAPFDLELVQETRNQIRTVVQEIQQLTHADIPEGEFYGALLARIVMAMASFGGAIWKIDEDGNVELQYQVNFGQTGAAEAPEDRTRHQWLIRRTIAEGQAVIVPPNAGPGDPNEPGNPTPFLLVLAPIKVEQRVEGLIEIFQRSAGGLPTQRGYLRFLTQMADQAASFLRLHRLRSFGQRHTLWEKIERYVQAVHRGLDTQEIAYAIANDGRGLLECDRVSVVVHRPRGLACLAVSGVELVNSRASEVRRLEDLARVVAAANRPVWSTQSGDLPPQISELLDQQIDHSHARLVGVIPLRSRSEKPHGADSNSNHQTGTGSAAGTGSRDVHGVLIVEQFQGELDEGLLERTELVARHAADALANALEYEQLAWLPFLRWGYRNRLTNVLRRWPPGAVIALTGLVLATFLAAIPVNFSLVAHGKLRPSDRHEIFATQDGIVVEVSARHEKAVAADEVLARLSNSELQSEITRLESELRTNDQHIARLEREQHDHRLSASEQSRVSGELVDRKQQRTGLERQLQLKLDKQKQLEIRSPAAGTVVTWRVEELLMRRPVQKGQTLMTVVNPAGDWELELMLPERHGGHLRRALDTRAKTDKAGLPPGPAELTAVTFRLASHPDQVFHGHVQEVRRTAEVDSEQGNAVGVRVAIDGRQLPERRADTSVVAKIHCGQRSLGYVVLRELIETCQRHVLFWF